jgi:hypothetical protein
MEGGNNEIEKPGEKIRNESLSRLNVSPDQFIPNCM